MKNLKIMFLIMISWIGTLYGMESSLSIYAQPITALAVSDNGHYWVAGFYSGQIILVNAVTQRGVVYGEDIKVAVSAIAIGDYIIVGYEDGRVQVFDLNLKEIYNLTPHDRAISKIVVDGTAVVTYDDTGSFRIWDLSTGKCLFDVRDCGCFSAIAVSYATKKLYMADCYMITEWDFSEHGSEDISPRNRFLSGYRNPILSLVIQNDKLWSISASGSLRLWDIPSRDCLQRHDVGLCAECIKIDPCQQNIVIVFNDHIAIYDLETGYFLEQIKIPEHQGGKIALGGNILVTGNYLNSIDVVRYTCNSVLIKNELDYPIRRIILLDKHGRPYTGATDCASHAHKMIKLPRIDDLCAWYINFHYHGMNLKVGLGKNLQRIREILFAYRLKNGDLLALITRWREKKNGWAAADTSVSFDGIRDSEPSCEDDLHMLFFTIGKAISRITLTDYKKNVVAGKQNKDLPSLWNMEGIHRYPPYQLQVHAHDGWQYSWEVPYLLKGVDGMLLLPDWRGVVAEPSRAVNGPYEIQRHMSFKSFSAEPRDIYSAIRPMRTRSLSMPAMYVTEHKKGKNNPKKPRLVLYDEVSGQEWVVPGCRTII